MLFGGVDCFALSDARTGELEGFFGKSWGAETLACSVRYSRLICKRTVFFCTMFEASLLSDLSSLETKSCFFSLSCKMAWIARSNSFPSFFFEYARPPWQFEMYKILIRNYSRALKHVFKLHERRQQLFVVTEGRHVWRLRKTFDIKNCFWNELTAYFFRKKRTTREWAVKPLFCHSPISCIFHQYF